MKNFYEYKWLGSENMHLDKAYTQNCGDVFIGCYGGNTSAGGDKNEDGCFVLCDREERWRFSMLLDSHTTNESAKLVLNTVENKKSQLVELLNLPLENVFSKLQNFFVDIFSSEEFKAECKKIKGKAACLICVQKDQFLWWLSIGDNLVFLFHPELAELGQFSLNQRQFYEWVGYENSFNLQVPCYSSGVRQLREGINYVFLLTDGVLECGKRPFENSQYLYETLTSKEFTKTSDIKENILKVLNVVHQEKGRDSATIVGWSCVNNNKALRPSG